MSRKPAEILTR